MKNAALNLIAKKVLGITLSLTIVAAPVLAQRNMKTDTRMLYHNGPVMTSTSHIYLIWYGTWDGAIAVGILTDFASNLGSSSYFNIHRGYPNSVGGSPNGALIYAGAVFDSYSQGPTLSPTQIQAVVSEAINNGSFPLDPAGIYLVLGSPDVTDIHPDGTSYCTPGKAPHHGNFNLGATPVKYAYIGNPLRCPTSAAPQLPIGGPTPNDDFAGDGMANTIAAALGAVVTNPQGNGWFDRFGLENTTKCKGIFGITYLTENNARANIKIGPRHYLLQQNWVNDRKGFCSLSTP